MTVARGLLDTSVFIAQESGRRIAIEDLPEASAVSVITVAELHAGVLGAGSTDTRARRLRTLDLLADMTILPIDEEVAGEWARLRVFLFEAQRRAGVNDLWIAATALVRDIPVVTQDNDFDVLASAGLQVVRV